MYKVQFENLATDVAGGIKDIHDTGLMYYHEVSFIAMLLCCPSFVGFRLRFRLCRNRLNQTHRRRTEFYVTTTNSLVGVVKNALGRKTKNSRCS